MLLLPGSTFTKKQNKRTHQLKVPVSKEKRISFKSPMVPIEEFEDMKLSEDKSSPSQELILSPPKFRRELTSNIIGVSYFESQVQNNLIKWKGTPGKVSNFSTNKSSAKKISSKGKKGDLSKFDEDTSSDEESSSSECLSWAEGKSANPYSDIYDDTKSKRYNAALRRKSAYLIRAPVKVCKCQRKDSDAESDDEDDSMNGRININKFSPKKKERRMTVKVTNFRI